MFAPVLRYFSTAVIGPPEDNLVFAWNLWWGRQALTSSNASLTYTHDIFFPKGHSLLLHSMSWFNVMVGAVLQGFMSLPSTYNFLTLLSFVIGGVGAFILARDRIGDWRVALLAGFIFAFNPLHFAQSLHHLNIASIQFLPWFVGSHLRATERDGWIPSLKTAVWFALSVLCSWYFLVYGLLFLIADPLIRSVQEQRTNARAIRASVIAAGGALVLLSPLVVPMIKLFLGLSGPSREDPLDPTNFNAADLFSFLWPNPYSPWWGAPETFVHKPFTGHTWEITVPLGLANLALLVIGLRCSDRRRSRYDLAMLIGFGVLAMGTQLRVLGRAIGPAVLPYALLRELPLFNSARVPPRAMVFGYLFLALLAARGLKRLLDSDSKQWRRWTTAIAMACALITLVEFWSTTSLFCVHRTPAVYAQLPSDGARYGILELPSGTHVKERAYMYYQTLHGLPIAGGFMARPQHYGVFDELEKAPMDKMGEILTANSIRFIVVETAATDPRLVSEVARLFPRVYSDSTHDLFAVRPDETQSGP